MKNLFACLILILALPFQAQAQGRDGAAPSLWQSEQVAEFLTDYFTACAQVPAAYRFDCLHWAFRRAARKLDNNASYWEAEVALTRVGRQLDRLVRDNADPDADRLRAAGERLRAVSASAVPDLTGSARSIIDQAEALMRDGFEEEVTLFAPIADAVTTVQGL